MSADNGIYIGKFPCDGGFEYRVVEAQAIENCDDDASGKFTIWLTDAYVVSYYGDAPAFKDKDEAERYADQLYKELMDDSGFCEYGICLIEYPRSVKRMTRAEAERIINGYFDDNIFDGGEEGGFPR